MSNIQDNSNTFEKKPKSRKPSDFDSAEDFIQHARKTYNDDTEADRLNREEHAEDSRFVAGLQWDEAVRSRRLYNKKPTMVFNRLIAIVAQVVGNRRLNETQIKIVADHNGSREAAKVREGLIRNIQKTSTAKRAYDAAYQNQVIGGLGEFQLTLDYVSDDVFEQEMSIEPIYDHTAVVWDRGSQDPTGRDARHVFVEEYMDRKEFTTAYPDADPANFTSDQTGYHSDYMDGWVTKDRVRIVDFWRIRSRKRTLALMLNGEVNDVTDLETDEWLYDVASRDGAPIVREAMVKYAEMFKLSADAILEGPYEMPIDRVPVFRAPGWEINLGEYKSRFGIVRWLRDPQRMHNYWRSVIAEKLMEAPRSKWQAGKTAIEGYEKQYRESHLSEDSLLVYNDEAGPNARPERIPPTQMEAAFINEAGMAANDLKDISNIHEANLGQTSNEVSGKAIMARVRVGETGTTIYQDNLNMALEECGRVMNKLIPYVYDTPRVLKILREDDDIDPEYVRVNYDGDDSSIDISSGKYSTTSMTGPSTATKRIEAAESMMSAVNAMPDVFASAADLVAEAQDWPKADVIAKRLRSRMPPDMLGEDATPEQQQQMQGQAQAQAQEQQMQQAAAQAEIANKAAEAEERKARAAKLLADIDNDRLQTAAQLLKTDSDIDSQKINDVLQTVDAINGENNV